MNRTTMGYFLYLAGLLLLAGCSQKADLDPYRPVAPPPPMKGTEETRHKALTPEQIGEIERTINVGRDGITDCYSRELERRGDKKLQGKVSVSILIGTNGRVKAVEISESTLDVERVHQCILDKVRTWEFPKVDEDQPYSTTFFFDPAY